MSHGVLQLVVVRMQYDPRFRAQVFDQADVALAGLALSTAERRWLQASDPRAYATDPHLQSRTLKTLIEEYPAATLLLGVEPLWGFFSAGLFHHAVASRGRLALVFHRWIAEQAGDTVPAEAIADVASLEHAVATARRFGVGLARVGDQAMAHYTQVRAVLATRETAIEDIILGAVGPPKLATESQETSFLLAQRVGGDDEVSLSDIDEALFDVLDAHARDRDPRAEARRHGATAAEADALVAELRGEGLLR